jgi:hypothetical protein
MIDVAADPAARALEPLAIETRQEAGRTCLRAVAEGLDEQGSGLTPRFRAEAKLNKP